MNRLVLLRHGRTEGTERHLYYGATDLPLLEDGVQNLQLAAARGVYPSPDGFTFVTSGMLRANQTLRAIYGDVPFSVIDDLREVNFGIFEMKSYEELKNEMVYQDSQATGFGTCRRGENHSQTAKRGSCADWMSFFPARMTRSASATAGPFSRRWQSFSLKRGRTATLGSRNPALDTKSIW